MHVGGRWAQAGFLLGCMSGEQEAKWDGPTLRCQLHPELLLISRKNSQRLPICSFSLGANLGS